MKKLFTSSGTLWSCLVALAMMMASQSARAEYVKLTALAGVDAWSGGGETHPSLVDTKIDTKWGCWFDPSLEVGWPEDPEQSSNICYIIVKAEKAVNPEWYFLVTGNDTGSNPGRNWASWKIYGGNFESDELAVRGGEGWTLLDDKQDEPLPEANYAPVNLQFDYVGTETFQYFWIEVEATVAGADVYQQMAEWGLGSYGELEAYLQWLQDQGTSKDEPVNYYFIEVDSNTAGFGGEGCANLFDGNTGTKWCTGFTDREEGETTNGSYFIFKASRSMAPSYYTMTTANDTQSNPGRNWKQWRIYGMNASSQDAVKRESEDWVLLDTKQGIGTDQLPAANYTQAFFTLTEGNTTEYRYFKVEIDKAATSGLIQMSEFALGDEYTFILDRNAVVEGIEEQFDPDIFAEKTLLDEMTALIASISASTDPTKLGDLSTAADAKMAEINASANNYAELLTARNQAVNAIEGGNLKEEAVAYLTAWIGEAPVVVIAPNEDYPVGNLAYIKANRQITGAEALKEANRINAYIINNAAVEVDPIRAIYKFLSGTTDNWNAAEGPEYLIDGDRDNTKWGTATSSDRFLIFKSINPDTEEDEPIQPTYYGLVTGGDTSDYPDRNWKNWKIFAANFDSDEEATKNSDKWVLIDNKQNIGTDILKTTSLFESYIYLSEGCAQPYTYFKIEVYQSGGMQMNEFTFYNTGNLKEYRESFIFEFEDYNPDDMVPAYSGYVNGYKEKYEELCTTVNAPDLMKIKNELVDLQTLIEESNVLYGEYEDIYAEVEGLSIDAENLGAWQKGYTTENVAPCAKYIRGTHAYILDPDTQLGALDNDGLKAETEYLTRIVTAVDNDLYILLGGHTVGEWGDGFYGNLIDGIDKDTKDENGEVIEKGTKWGGQADAGGDTYIIFRTFDPTNPFFYTLTTGNDTKTQTGRNWKNWYIYGANFEGDGDATKDAEGWVLIDAKEDIGQDRLHPENETPSYFGFSTETTVPYIYYKVVVTKAFSGTAVQMNELHFGTAEEFEEIKDNYTNEAKEFETEVVAQQELIDKYIATIPEIDECMNMEALFRVNYQLETLRDSITASAAMYAKFKEKVEEAKAYLEENKLAESEALTKLVNYITTDEEPTETYPNGTFANIYDEHVLADSVIAEEIEFLQAMKAAAVAAGYGKGMVITDLIVNPTFAKAGEMLKDEKGTNIGREAEGWEGYIYRTANAGGDVYAAEFCNENAKFDVSQTLSGLKNGFYKVTLNGGYRANGDEKMLSYNYAPLAYANEVATYVPVLIEGAAETEEEAWKGIYPDKQIFNVDSTETYGYGMWGCEGAANAFAQGRYAITLVAKVTDGKLTIGVKNDGTKGNEWTGVGNFGLVYLGEAETDAADALKEVAEYNAARIISLTELYESGTELYEDYTDAPGFGAAQKETLKENSGKATYEAELTIGETMKSIYETKKAYVALFNASEKVYSHWIDYALDTAMEEAVYDVRDNLDAGAYADAEVALAAKAQLYAAYPDYLQLKNSSKVAVDQEEFTFSLETEGTRPYLDLANIYEPLTEDKTILAFDYTAAQDLENGRMLYNTPNLMTDPVEEFAAMPATEEWTTVYVNVSNGMKKLQFGSAVDHGIRWYFNYNVAADTVLKLAARNFRFITKAQMEAEGGKTLNGTKGDLNGDNKVDIADAVTVLDIMAAGEYDAAADLNGDQKVDIADFVTILDIMAAQ